MSKSYSHFFSKKFQHICVLLDLNFNESLTNDVVSFEQQGPDEFRRSLEVVSQHKSDTRDLGDLNYPNLNCDGEDVFMIKPGCTLTKLYEDFIETLNDFNLSQMVHESTRAGDILDLYLTSNSTLFESLSIIAGLFDLNN